MQVIVEASTCVFWSFFRSSAGWMVLNALEKLKNMILTGLQTCSHKEKIDDIFLILEQGRMSPTALEPLPGSG